MDLGRYRGRVNEMGFGREYKISKKRINGKIEWI